MDIESLTENEKHEIINYGLQRGKSICISIVMTLLLGWIFHIFYQSVIFLISFICLRRYAGGYHASTQERCYMISFGTIIAAFLAMKYICLNWLIMTVIQTANFLILFLLVPVDSENHRLEQWEKKKYGRKARIVSIITYISCLILFTSTMKQTANAIGVANLVTGGFVIAGYVLKISEKF